MVPAKAAFVMGILVHAFMCESLLIVQFVNAGLASVDGRSGRLRASKRRAEDCPPYHPHFNFAEINFRPARDVNRDSGTATANGGW